VGYRDEAKRLERIRLIMPLLLAFGLVLLAEFKNFRCNNVIFSIGDSKGEIALQCGPPDYEEIVKLLTIRKYDDKRKAYIKETVEVVDWHYNCGEREFIKILTFRGGRLSSVRNAEEWGSGENIRNCW
jgi:hypothetical protein